MNSLCIVILFIITLILLYAYILVYIHYSWTENWIAFTQKLLHKQASYYTKPSEAFTIQIVEAHRHASTTTTDKIPSPNNQANNNKKLRQNLPSPKTQKPHIYWLHCNIYHNRWHSTNHQPIKISLQPWHWHFKHTKQLGTHVIQVLN